MQSSGIQTFCLRGTSCHRLEDFKAVGWSSWLGEVPEDWKGADITHIFKEGKKEGPGKYKPVRLTLVPGNILLERISTRMRIRRWLGSIHQNGFAKGKSCLTNPVTFHDEVTDWMDEERAAEVVYLNFSKDFDAVCHDIVAVGSWWSMGWRSGQWCGLKTGWTTRLRGQDGVEPLLRMFNSRTELLAQIVGIFFVRENCKAFHFTFLHFPLRK